MGRPLRLLRGLLLLGLAAMIGRLFASGEMVKYMSPALDPLTALAGLALVGMGLVELLGGGESEEHASPSEQLLTSLVLLVPLALGLLYAPRALGAAALGGERIEGLLLSFGSEPAPPRSAPPPLARPIEDTPDLLAYLRQAGEQGVGQRVRLAGMVVRSEALASDEFGLLRYSIAHCVADARPVALLVRGGAAAAQAGDEWVQVEGRLASLERDGERLVAVEAETIRAIAEPANPYLAAN
jgi:uncharacterized repeat protein (TIGR03943 family)